MNSFNSLLYPKISLGLRASFGSRSRTPLNAKSQAPDAALSRQVACTDGLGAGVPPAPTFNKGENDERD